MTQLTQERARHRCRSEDADRAAGTLRDGLRSTPMPRLGNDWSGVNATWSATKSALRWREFTDRHQLPLGHRWLTGHYVAPCADAEDSAFLRSTQGGGP
jgi:hypothetical protein